MRKWIQYSLVITENSEHWSHQAFEVELHGFHVVRIAFTAAADNDFERCDCDAGDTPNIYIDKRTAGYRDKRALSDSMLLFILLNSAI